ncbi:MAG: hypothetical protein ACLUVD_07615 [Mediterraneibacter faecis]
MLTSSILCNDSTNADGQEIGDPTETALINLGSKSWNRSSLNSQRNSIQGQWRVPFDSDRKMMSTAHSFRWMMRTDDRQRSSRCPSEPYEQHLDWRYCKGDNETRGVQKRIEAQNQEFPRDGLRVLAFAYKELDGEGTLTTGR